MALINSSENVKNTDLIWKPYDTIYANDIYTPEQIGLMQQYYESFPHKFNNQTQTENNNDSQNNQTQTENKQEYQNSSEEFDEDKFNEINNRYNSLKDNGKLMFNPDATSFVDAESSDKLLNDLAAYIKDTGSTASIEGFIADASHENDPTNLSGQRADTVKQELINRGVNAEKLNPVSGKGAGPNDQTFWNPENRYSQVTLTAPDKNNYKKTVTTEETSNNKTSEPNILQDINTNNNTSQNKNIENISTENSNIPQNVINRMKYINSIIPKLNQAELENPDKFNYSSDNKLKSLTDSLLRDYDNFEMNELPTFYNTTYYRNAILNDLDNRKK